MDNNDSNNLIILGVTLLIIGILVAIYSFSSYIELKELNKNIDFELIDDNQEMTANQKFNKYVSISEFLNTKIDKNKNILLKNTSCAYIDYAQHNAIKMYELAKKQPSNEEKQITTLNNIRTLDKALDNYSTCKKAVLYKAELQNILMEIRNTKTSNVKSEDRMQQFLNGYRERKAAEQEAADNSQINEEPVDANEVYNSYPQDNTNEETIDNSSETRKPVNVPVEATEEE